MARLYRRCSLGGGVGGAGSRLCSGCSSVLYVRQLSVGFEHTSLELEIADDLVKEGEVVQLVFDEASDARRPPLGPRSKYSITSCVTVV